MYGAYGRLFATCGRHIVFIFIFCNVQVQTKSIAAARLAQSAERKALNLVVVGSSTTVGDGESPQFGGKTLRV